MAMFPKIQSPCPYKSQLSLVMDGDFCRMCQRQVIDLTAMTDGERVAFLQGCAEEVCVSYRMPALAALAAVAVLAPFAAAAQDATTVDFVTIGGIKDPAHVEFVQDAGDQAIPQMPVVYDDASPPGSKPAATPTEAQGPAGPGAGQVPGRILTSSIASQRSRPAS